MIDGLRLHLTNNNDPFRVQGDDRLYPTRWTSQGKRRVGLYTIAGPDARGKRVVRRRAVDASYFNVEAIIGFSRYTNARRP